MWYIYIAQFCLLFQEQHLNFVIITSVTNFRRATQQCPSLKTEMTYGEDSEEFFCCPERAL